MVALGLATAHHRNLTWKLKQVRRSSVPDRHHRMSYPSSLAAELWHSLQPPATKKNQGTSFASIEMFHTHATFHTRLFHIQHCHTQHFHTQLFHTICLPPSPISFMPSHLMFTSALCSLEEVNMWGYPVLLSVFPDPSFVWHHVLLNVRKVAACSFTVSHFHLEPLPRHFRQLTASRCEKRRGCALG